MERLRDLLRIFERRYLITIIRGAPVQIMKQFSQLAIGIFREAIQVYLQAGSPDTPCTGNSYPEQTIEHDLFRKNWIDHAQWGMEDLIRDPEIDPVAALQLKRRIDRSNQERTDLVELIDSFFYTQFASVTPREGAKINTESPAWAIDRLSILELKLHYMAQAVATATDDELRAKCQAKLTTLQTQEQDLATAIDELLEDIAAGRKYMKVYKQMKMYNDPQLNPMLRGQQL